jgi:hypothetical protein
MREKREANANATWRALIRDRPRGVLYGVAIDRAVMAYKGTETDVLYGVEMAWRADATAHALLTRGFTF